MPYTRVIPRDLFNEAKLLKCLGQLSLLIHNGVGIRWPLALVHCHPNCDFAVDQNRSDAGLYCQNLTLRLGKHEIHLKTAYNSQDAYPLLFEDWSGSEGEVFNSDGTFTTDFCTWLDTALEFINNGGVPDG